MIEHKLAALYDEHISRLSIEYGNAIGDAGYDALVIHSGAAREQCRFDDQNWPLRPTPAFRHWLPLAEADCALIIEPGAVPRLHRTVVSDFWEGHPAVESEHFWDSFAVHEVASAADIRAALPAARLAFIGAPDRARSWAIEEEAINPAGLLAALDLVRAHKSAYEVECIAAANHIAARGHQLLTDSFAAGDHSELDLHLRFLAATNQDDAETPYKNIVALGEHAAVLHHVHYDRVAPSGADQSLLVDAGATYLGYAADITRTSVKGARRSAHLFAELIGRMETFQQQLCSQLVPGLAYEELHDQAHQLLADVLVDLGIASASPDELVDSGATRSFFPHGLGHSLGLQTHDVGCRPRPPRAGNEFLRTTIDVAAGNVLTIEPGCYFIDSLLAELRSRDVAARIDWPLVAELGKFGGVRIEDNVAVGAVESRNLTRDNWPTRP